MRKLVLRGITCPDPVKALWLDLVGLGWVCFDRSGALQAAGLGQNGDEVKALNGPRWIRKQFRSEDS
jgi:hypothetical protein